METLHGTNRFVLVDETGRRYERVGVVVQTDLQDGGKTLKIFIHEGTGWNSPENVKRRMVKAMSRWLEANLPTLSTPSLPNTTTEPSTGCSGSSPTT